MPRKAALALILGTLLFSPAQAGDYLSPMEAQEVAQELVDRIVSYVSANPEKAGDLPELSGTRITDPTLVHRYPDLTPSYYVVPAVGSGGEITCLIGTSAEKKDWQWFTRARLEAFPKVTKDQAYQICAQMTPHFAVSEPRAVDMPNKKMYWLCRTNDADLNEIFVNIEDPTEVHTNLDADISDLTTGVGPIRIPGQHPESPVQRTPDRSPSYPDAYNIEDVPFYYQETSWYCCEASLEMIFDYWGPDISQDDIGDVANDIPGGGTGEDDLRRASHFSYISTAIQNPSLHGYDERDLGYSSIEADWSTPSLYPDRYDDLKNLISNDYPIVVATWYSASHYSTHCRVLKGYDDWLNHFIVHDPWYGSPYGGPDVHFNQEFFVDDLWECGGRWGLFSAPWKASFSVPPVIYADELLTIDANFTYTAFHPFEGQYRADSVSATIYLPPGFQLISPPSPTINFGSQYSGFVGNPSWEILAPSNSSGPDTIRMEVKGKIVGYCTSYPTYWDWIGGETEVEVTTVFYVRGDVNRDHVINASDVVYLLNFLYRGGPPPWSPEAADVNCDYKIDSGDVVYLLNYLYRGGPPPCS